MYTKNELLDIEITDLTTEGEGVGKVDGFTFFVKDTIIGDVATIRVTKVKKTYGYGRLEKIVKSSPYRQEPVCSVSRQCGGCQIQCMKYPEQLKYKANKVKNNLVRLGGFDKEFIDSVTEPVIGMDEEAFSICHTDHVGFGYRNKAQYPFGKDKKGNTICGFYAGRTHSIIANTDCALGAPENKDILETILTWMNKYRIEPYDETTRRGYVRHALIRKGFHTGEIMVCLVINDEKLPKEQTLVSMLLELNDKFNTKYGSEIKNISVSPNKNDTNVIMGNTYRTIYGTDTITDTLLGKKYSISPLSFYQINPVQVEKLYGKAIEYANLKPDEEAWDICCGIGTITMSMSNEARLVHGIEIVPQAIEDAKHNAVVNGVDNVEFICAAAEDYLPAHEKEIKADVIVMDPPRKGMDEKALSVVVQAAPSRIVYVSCDSATLARDLKYLCEHGYKLSKVQPVEMFAQTVHTEVVCLILKA